MPRRRTELRTIVALAVLAALAGCGMSESSRSTSETRVKNLVVSDLFNSLLGRTGPGGGIIFYVGLRDNPPPNSIGAVLVAMEALSLESDFANVETAKLPTWGCGTTAIPEAHNEAVGAGANNTEIVAAACGEQNIWARRALDLRKNGRSDWFLPSIGELHQLCLFKHRQTGDVTTPCNVTRGQRAGTGVLRDRVWSSNEGNWNYAKAYDFTTGGTPGVAKNSTGASAIVVRAFSPVSN